MRPANIGLTTLLTCAALLAACAALEPPVQFETRQSSSDDSDQKRALTIEPVEGRPEGLVMRFAATDRIPREGFLEVWRSADEKRAAPLRRVRLDDELYAALVADGFDFLDRAVTPGHAFEYQLRIRHIEDGEPGPVTASSRPVGLDWEEPPAPPESVTAASSLPGVVELSWEAEPPRGMLVFRRDVLDSDAKPRRLTRVARGAHNRFIDRDVEPGGVYAYRVASARDRADIVQFGRPSSEVYVTVSASPGDGRPTP
ncbi:MAG: hypothetical protein ACOCV2_01830 [Persicimonas sp.]